MSLGVGGLMAAFVIDPAGRYRMKSRISQLCALIDRLNTVGAALAATCCAILGLLLIGEVIVTSGFDWSQPWAVEYSAYLCALALFAGSGYAVRQAAHIRVRIALTVLPAWLSRWLDFLCTCFAFTISTVLAYGMVELAVRSWQRGSTSYFVMETPLAIPQGLLAVSACLLMLALLARALRLIINEAPDLAQPAFVTMEPSR